MNADPTISMNDKTKWADVRGHKMAWEASPPCLEVVGGNLRRGNRPGKLG